MCGRKGSGKDEAVKYLISRYGGRSIAFSEPLYTMMYSCQNIMGIERHKDRKFLTTMGDFFRAKDPNIFITHCFNVATHYSIMSDTPNIYITDGRYKNELDAGKYNGFKLIQIVASDGNRQNRRPGENILDSHSSENGYPDDYEFDATIQNNGTLEELYNNLDNVIQSFNKG